MKKSFESWSQYLQNRQATKNPKTFAVTLKRNSNGEYEIVGHNAFMEAKTGGSSEWVKVDARDLARSIRNSGLIAK